MEWEGSFRSTKHEGEGIGTQSIRYIAQQYNGAADFRWEDGMFYASVFLNPREKGRNDTDFFSSGRKNESIDT